MKYYKLLKQDNYVRYKKGIIYEENFLHPCSTPRTNTVKELSIIDSSSWQEVTAYDYYLQESKLPEEYVVNFVGSTANRAEVIHEYYKTCWGGTYANFDYIICANAMKNTSANGRIVENHIREEFENLPRFTYQQWKTLKDLNMKEEFVLPNKWHIKITDKNKVILNNWKKGKGCFDDLFEYNYIVVGYDGSGGYCDGEYIMHPEITFEQFKKYVLKQTDMERKIIGYKLKKDCEQYEKAASSLMQAEFGKNFVVTVQSCINLLVKAEVLNLWFEPIYEEQFKVGDWVSFTSEIDKCTYTSKIKDWTSHSYCILENGAEPFKHLLRKATPEEIKAVQIPKITINGYKGEFYDDYVKFGCAEIHKTIFIDLNTLNKDLLNGDGVIGMKSNRQIESVTIGKGTFTKDQIKEIAEYYINKK